MPLSPLQLLEPDFQPATQGCLWPENTGPLRFVAKLHRATKLHYDLRFELYGRLLSFSISDVDNCWSSSAPMVRVDDHDPEYLLGERCIPKGSYGAGPMLVWDHGIYRSQLGTEEDVYRQLLNGSLEVDVQGIRLQGRFRIDGRGKHWRIHRLSGDTTSNSQHSVLTGRTLDEIESGLTTKNNANRLWLEWESYYTEQTADPEIVIHEKKVVDHNFAAKARGISNGMPLHHVLPLIEKCQTTSLS